jgi:4a-hydroxytetrahydrobiopterin dehydratase
MDFVPRLLSDREVDAKLRGIEGWKREGKFITKSVEFEEFMEGIRFVQDIAKIAEEEEHHPDINIRYTTVKLSLQTHSAGGVTEWDFGLARRIEDYLIEKHRRRLG